MTHAEWFWITLLIFLTTFDDRPPSWRYGIGVILLTGTMLFNGALAFIDLIQG